MIKICVICHKEYRTHRKKQVFCSMECKNKNIKECSFCGKEYKSEIFNYKTANYCSKQCHYDALLKNTIYKKKCLICNKDFESKAYNALFCSYRCYLNSIKKPLKEKACKWCGNKFFTKAHALCCSSECKRLSKQKNRKIKRQHNIELRIKDVLRNWLYRALKRKQKRTPEYIDYSVNELMTHLKSLFKENMSFKNYGKWHIDHKKPLALFKFYNKDGGENLEQIKKAMSLENLQPLWAKDNISKGARFIA